MKHPEKRRVKRTSKVTRKTLEHLLADMRPVAGRLHRRLEKLARPADPEKLELHGALQDIVLGQVALVAAVSALLEIQVEVKAAFGES